MPQAPDEVEGFRANGQGFWQPFVLSVARRSRAKSKDAVTMEVRQAPSPASHRTRSGR